MSATIARRRRRERADYDDVLARIERSLAETRKFAEKAPKLAAEREKLVSEALKLGRDRALAPWQVVAASATATAAVIAACAGVAALVARAVAGGG